MGESLIAGGNYGSLGFFQGGERPDVMRFLIVPHSGSPTATPLLPENTPDPAAAVSPRPGAVLKVLLMSSRPKMLWVDASRVMAAMVDTHSLGDRTDQ